jgi:hypothetical protein
MCDMYPSHLFHTIWLRHPIADAYKLWNSLYSFLQSVFASFLLGPNILICTPLSNRDEVYALRLLLYTEIHTHKAHRLYINFEQQILTMVFSSNTRNGQLTRRECKRFTKNHSWVNQLRDGKTIILASERIVKCQSLRKKYKNKANCNPSERRKAGVRICTFPR